MAFFKVSLAVAIVMQGPILGHCANKMACGEGVPLCGTLTLQSGFGQGVYQSKTAGVHGLWPEVGEYGSSKCIAPKDSKKPSKVYDCYSDAKAGPGPGGQDDVLAFETHEWTKHGKCAGVKDVDDFFDQVCALAKTPVEILDKLRESAGADFGSLLKGLKSSGYPVWSIDEENAQFLLSACAGNDGQWVLSTIAEMPSKCGGSSPSPGPSPPSPSPPSPAPPSPAPPSPAPPSGGSCSAGKKGPACKSNGDCSGKGCVRCAHSGYCTDTPLSGGDMVVV